MAPAPRLSLSAEAARSAAAQAEFNEKKWVWVPDDKEGYLAGWVIREEADAGEVVMASGGEVSKYCSYIWFKFLTGSLSDTARTAVCAIENESSKV